MTTLLSYPRALGRSAAESLGLTIPSHVLAFRREAMRDQVVEAPHELDSLEERQRRNALVARNAQLLALEVPCPTTYTPMARPNVAPCASSASVSVGIGAKVGAAAAVILGAAVISVWVLGGPAASYTAVAVLLLALGLSMGIEALRAISFNRQAWDAVPQHRGTLPAGAPQPLNPVNTTSWGRSGAAKFGKSVAAEVGQDIVQDSKLGLRVGLFLQGDHSMVLAVCKRDLEEQIRTALGALRWPDSSCQVVGALQHALNLAWYEQVGDVAPGHRLSGRYSLSACVCFRGRMYLASVGATQATWHPSKPAAPTYLSPLPNSARVATFSQTPEPLAHVVHMPLGEARQGRVVLMSQAAAERLPAIDLVEALHCQSAGVEQAAALLIRARERGAQGDIGAMVITDF